MLVFENCEIDLENTFHCGQTFRWKRRGDGSFAGNVLGRAVRAQVRDGALCLLGAAEEDAPFWRAYFDLDSDYAALLAPVMDDHLRGALRDCRGIRLLGFLRPVQKTVVKFRQRGYDRTKKGGQSTETGGTL